MFVWTERFCHFGRPPAVGRRPIPAPSGENRNGDDIWGYLGRMASTLMPTPNTGDRRVCSVCVLEEFLSAEIEKDGAPATCLYCGLDGNTFSVDEIATSVGTILSDFYSRMEPPKGEPVNAVISDVVKVCDDAAEDIRSVLANRYATEWADSTPEDNPFGTNECYAKSNPIDTWDFNRGWRDFEKKLKTEARYFNRYAESWLRSLFEGIASYRTISGRPIVVDAGPGTTFTKLYRARVFQSKVKLREAMKRPDIEIGPPPSLTAAAGRMNAAGIGVFYGATESLVAIAEVRPPVGSKVLVGCFEVIRPLRLLDLVAMKDISNEPGSLFDEGHRHQLKQVEFLRGLSERISKPVMPDDQVLDYLPTQAIADFLATEATPPLDGIIYPSVQIGTDARSTYGPFSGRRGTYRCNVVLFQKAARIQSLDKNAAISVSDDSWLSGWSDFIDDGPDVKYTVWVEGADGGADEDDTTDDVSLMFAGLEVHFVSAVKVETRHNEIFRFPKAEPENAGEAPEASSDKTSGPAVM